MGNANSSEKGSAHDKQSLSSTSPRDASHPSQESRDLHGYKRAAKRRESVPALPHARAAPAPPSESLESAQGRPSSTAASTTTSGHIPSHSRGRSQTSVSPSPQAQDRRSRENADPNGQPSQAQQARPVDVPAHPVPTDPNVQPRSVTQNNSSSVSPSSYHIPNSQYNRPPRLPLPIEQEDFAPGSPIISPADLPGPLGQDSVPEEETAQLEHKNSILSNTTVEDDEVPDDFQTHGKASGHLVDTLVEWKEGGDRVYVTGSFSGWTKKHRLHRNGPSKDPKALSAIIPLQVGAHHMTFLVDGQMLTSRHLPTAVDYTNVLINYIEVSADDLPKPSQPVDIQRRQEPPFKQPNVLDSHRPPTEGRRGSIFPPPTPELKPTQNVEPPSVSGANFVPSAEANEHPAPPKPSPSPSAIAQQVKRTVIDNKRYHSEIPVFLEDLDAPDDSHRYARANAVMNTMPTPPSLPMFLNKSILNGTLPMKDDASVLVLPNHTVLNHLATTSIKQHVLATSSTTRYKRKYVTTIMHRPTGEHTG
ncbi:MAG: hypothetical protein Q9159_000609 [Coniocarpon cinnabarinum]